MRVLIISAKVGEGHDAAARGIAEEILDGYPDADVRIENGLKIASPWAERMVVDGYKFQLRRAPWSYEALYTSIVKSRRFATFLYRLSGVVGGRRIQRLVEETDPDVVLSTYPLTSAMLAWLRERGRLTVPCTGILTDFAPHPLWLYEPLDANFVMHPGTIPATDDVPGMIGHPAMEVVAPPVSRRFYGPSRRAQARAALGIPEHAFVSLVVGGGWGVGELSSTAWAASSVADAWTVVVCGRNETLRKALTEKPPPRSIVLGFVDTMPDLMDAADVMVHNAGGCTSLEAFVRGCPLVVTGPIPGHGVTCAELMEKVGAAVYVRDPADLPVVLRACAGDAGLRPRAGALAAELGLYPATASRLAGLVAGSRARARGGPQLEPVEPMEPVGVPTGVAAGGGAAPHGADRRSGKRRLVAASVVALVGFSVLATGMPVSMAAGRLGLPAVRSLPAAGSAAAQRVGLAVVSEDPSVLADTARLLSRHGARATFFAPSTILEGVPDLRGTLSAAGEVGNGGTGRPVARLAGVRHVEQDIAEGRAQTLRASGRAPAFYLPIDATLTPAVYLAASREHQTTVVGSRRLRTAGDLRRPLRGGDVAVADLRGDTAGEARTLLLGLMQQTAGDDLQVVALSEAQRPSR